MIVPDKLHVTLRRGEIESLTFDRRTSALNLKIEDTTGIVKIVPVTIEGLEPGEYRVRTENSELRARASEKLEFEVAVEDAKSVHILPLKFTAPMEAVTVDEVFTVSIAGRAEPLTFRVTGKVTVAAPTPTIK